MRRTPLCSPTPLAFVCLLAVSGCASSPAVASHAAEAPTPDTAAAAARAPSDTPAVVSTGVGQSPTSKGAPNVTLKTASASTRAALRIEGDSDVDEEKALGGRRAFRTLAVLPFEPADTAVEELAVGFAELITADLAAFPGIKLLERIRVDDILQEQGLDTARIDASSALKVGRLMAAQRLVHGGIGSLGDTAVHFEVGVVNVGSSAIAAAFEGQATSDGIFEAERMVVHRLAIVLGLTVPPVLAARMQARRQYQAEVFRHFARAARLEADGDYEAAAATYAHAARLAPEFEVAQAKNAFMRQRMAAPARAAAMRRHRRARAARAAAAAAAKPAP